MARWNASSHTLEPVREDSLPPKGREKIQNRTRRISTILARSCCFGPLDEYGAHAFTSNAAAMRTQEAPFFELRVESPDGRPLVGNDRYDGYCVDLTNIIFARIGVYSYVFHEVKVRAASFTNCTTQVKYVYEYSTC